MARGMVLLLVLGLALPGYAAPPSQKTCPFLIVPGTSVGPVSVGMPFEEVLKQLGHYASRKITTPPRYIWTELPNNCLVGRFVVSTAGSSGPVLAISVSYDARYMTSTGIHVGDPSGNVRWTIGPPVSVSANFFDADVWLYPGIAFLVGNSNSKQCEGHVCGIGVGQGIREVF